MELSYTQRLAPGQQFLLPWVLANALGFGLAWVLILLVLSISQVLVGPYPAPVGLLFESLEWALVGLPIGIAQWVVLRRVLQVDGWVVANSIGWVFGIVLGGNILSATPLNPLLVLGTLPVDSLLTTIILAAAGAGFLQWIMLRGRVQRAWVWLVASIVGWGGGMLFQVPVGTLLAGAAAAAGNSWGGFKLRDVLPGIAAGTVSGIITGAALVWLVRHPSASE